MASAKEYGYFIKGNKLALIEKDTALDNDVNSRDYGPDVSNVRFKSPQSSVTDGIELEYVYSPKYQISMYNAVQRNKFYVNGWTVIDGYVTFIRGHSTGVVDWTASQYSTITSGSAGDTGGQSLDYIVVRDSTSWNGLHKVQTAGSNGILKTYTKANRKVKYAKGFTGTGGISVAAESDNKSAINGAVSSRLWLTNIFSVGDFIWMQDFGEAKNNGLFTISDSAITDTGGSEVNHTISITDRYYFSSTSALSNDELSTEQIDTTIDTTEESNANAIIFEAIHDPCYILTDVNVLNDEADELPITEYLSKAVVYYLKAKLAEDQGNFQLKEVMMREFYRIVEKSDNSKIHTIRKVAPSSAAIR